MVKSINKYKGFYIGRYETSDDYTHSSSINYFNNPMVVRYNSNIGYLTWYDSYKAQEKLAGKAGKYVETGMLYDSLWDYTLKWLNDTDTRSYEEIRVDSGTWGNYFNNTATVTSGDTKPAKTGAIETLTYKGEIYRDSPTASNNIFDLAGNVNEWNRSRHSAFSRRLRGGYNNGFSTEVPAYIVFQFLPTHSTENYGTRSELFIK